ncbi:MAG: DUF3137 domain-containing protein [Patescibacteria group bacterium]
MRARSDKDVIFFLIFIILIIAGYFSHGHLPDYVIYPVIIAFVCIMFARSAGRFFSVFKGMRQLGQSNLVLSPKVWSWQEGEALSFADIFPGLGEMIRFFSRQPKIWPKKMGQGTKQGVNYQIFQINFMPEEAMPAGPARPAISAPFGKRVFVHKINSPAASGQAQMTGQFRIMQARVNFPKEFPGRLILQRVNGPTIGRDIDLESVEFNKKTLVHTDQAKIAYQILSPDFMEWYLKLSGQPIIFFDHQQCFYTHIGFDSRSEADMGSIIEELIDRVTHSGALISSKI